MKALLAEATGWIGVPPALLATLGLVAGLGAFSLWSSRALCLALLIVSAGYALFRFGLRRHAAREGRLLQRIALGSPTVLRVSFDRERRRYLDRALEQPRGAPIFVTGLSRAGAAIVTRALHQTGVFAALGDRDMPFPLAPNHWATLSHHLDDPSALLASPDFDRPEAIEELFWRHREGARYIGAAELRSVAPRPATLDAFAEYVRIVQLRGNRRRYLSKNTNNILRLRALIATFPDARLIHPFRDPLQQAASLLNQHWRARSMAGDDSFRARFAGWMAHHEYGVDPRRFVLPGAPEAYEDANTLDYWLKSWIAVYSHLLAMPYAVRRAQLFLDYDRLVREGAELAPMLTGALDLATPLTFGSLRPPPLHAPAAFDATLLRRAHDLHAALIDRASLDLQPQEVQNRHI